MFGDFSFTIGGECSLNKVEVYSSFLYKGGSPGGGFPLLFTPIKSSFRLD